MLGLITSRQGRLEITDGDRSQGGVGETQVHVFKSPFCLELLLIGLIGADE